MQTYDLEKRQVEEELSLLISLTYQMEDELNSIMLEINE